MANYIEKYTSTIDRIMKEHQDKTEPGRLERLAYANASRGDFYTQPDHIRKERIDQERSKLIAEQAVDAKLDIEEAQRALKRDHQAELNRIERLKLRAATGSVTVSEYAKANGMLEMDAKAELDDYAKVKTSGFGDSLIDRYAAIRNIGKADGLDRVKAAKHAEDEAERLKIKDAEKAAKDANFYLNMHPARVLNEWESSGMALYNHFKGKLKE